MGNSNYYGKDNKKERSCDLKDLRKVEANLNFKDITIERYYYNEGALFTPQAKPTAKITRVCVTIQIEKKSKKCYCCKERCQWDLGIP